ncbi:MAG: hypothetical protein DA407_02250, partial [Bacteroidetes bacterium]
KNKTAKYFKYAIGEIILVVIGILIALQINNWNEKVKSKKLEVVYLSEILENIESDEEQLNEVISSQQIRYESSLKCLDLLSDLYTENTKSLDSIFISSMSNSITFFPTDGGYKSMISDGTLKIISNKGLSTRIANLYEHFYSRLEYNGEMIDKIYHEVRWKSQNYYDYKNLQFIDISENNIKEIQDIILYHLRIQKVYLERAKNTLDALLETKKEVQNRMNK